jgi:hypothetical protein
MIPRLGALAVAAALVAAPVRAEESGAPTVPIVSALTVEPNGCFDAVSLAPALARWLRRDAVDRRIRVEVAGQPDGPEGLTLRVRRDGSIVGERRFSHLSAPCAEVCEAVGLAAALAVDALVPAPLEVAPPPAVIPVVPAPPPRSPWPGIAASVDAVTLFGTLPPPVWAFAPGLALSFPPSMSLRFSGLVTAAGALALGRRSVDVALYAGRADVCAAFSAGVARVRACVGLASGRLQATTTGPKASLSPSAPWAAGIGRADVRVALRPWFGFVLGVDALFPFTHPRFQVVTPAGAEILGSDLRPIGGAVTLGPEITFR